MVIELPILKSAVALTSILCLIMRVFVWTVLAPLGASFRGAIPLRGYVHLMRVYPTTSSNELAVFTAAQCNTQPTLSYNNISGVGVTLK